MILSETYKNRLQELVGILLEKDNRSVIVNTLKLPNCVADWAHNLSEKYSIWIANIFKNQFYEELEKESKDKPGLFEELVQAFESGKSPEAFKTMLNKLMRQKDSQYRHIFDWLLRRQQIAPETDIIDFKSLTFEKAIERSNKWHDEVARLQRGRIEDEEGQIIMTFPDGFYWIDLGKSYCEKEAKAMAHCATARGTLYSLRKDKYPHITADVDNNGISYQIRGGANTKPKPEYHKFILPFLFEKVNELRYHSHREEEQFKLKDLSRNDLEKVIRTKPILLRNQIYTLTLTNAEKDLIITQYPEALNYTELIHLNLPSETLQKIINRNPKSFTNMRLDGLNFTPEQISYLIDREPNLFKEQHFEELNLTPEQIDKLIESKPEAFYSQNSILFSKLNSQQIRKLIDFDIIIFEETNLTEANFSDDDILYLLSKDKNGQILKEKQLIEYLSPEIFTKLYNENKDKFKSFYIKLKQKDYDSLKKVKLSEGKFTDQGVEIYFDDWTDENLTKLFEDPDVAKQIANYDLNFYGYNYQFNDLENTFDEINEGNLNEIRTLIKKEMGDAYPESATTHSQIFNLLYNDDEYGYDANEIKGRIVRATEMAQENADMNEYWKLYTKPIKELFGEPSWDEQEYKDKEGKVQTKHIMKFMVPYSAFQNYLEIADKEAGYGEEDFYYKISDQYPLNPYNIIYNYLEDEGKLEIDEPRYGVYGEIDDVNFNDILSDKLSDLTPA